MRDSALFRNIVTLKQIRILIPYPKEGTPEDMVFFLYQKQDANIH